MVYCVVNSRYVEGCTGDDASLVTIFNVLARFNSWLVHDFPDLEPSCYLIRRCSTNGATLFRIICSYSLYVLHKRDIGL